MAREGGGKRRSRRIGELCGLFEGGKEGDQSRLPTSTDSGGGEGRVSAKFEHIFGRKSTGGRNEQMHTNIPPNSFVCEAMHPVDLSECESDVKLNMNTI